jgi:ATP-dependent Clp protease ATP-binding subunit ClpB
VGVGEEWVHRLRSELVVARGDEFVEVEIKRLQALVADRKMTIELDDQARTLLANKGYDPIYGARPLKRVIQKHVQDPLAEEILRGTVKDGDTVVVSVKDGALTLNGTQVNAAAA